MNNIKLPSEHHMKFHRRHWQLYLLLCGVMAVGTVIAVLLPGDNSEVVLGPAAVVLILMFGMYLVMRGRDATAYEREHRRIVHDEWFAASRNRARRDALQTVVFAQVPLIFFMSYVPEQPSVIGMGMMTTALGGGAFAASYLLRTRPGADE